MSEQLRSVTDLETLLIEERRLRPSHVPPSDSDNDNAYGDGWGREKAGGEQPGEGRTKQVQPWFAKNVVDHRSARERGGGGVGERARGHNQFY